MAVTLNEVDELQVVDLRALVAALETAQHARREVLANHPLLAVLVRVRLHRDRALALQPKEQLRVSN